jgi:plastocyanin
MHGRARRFAVIGGLVLVATVSAACGGDDDDGGSTTGSGATGGGAEADLVASGTAFDPTSVPVAAGGDTITIVNEDGIDHTFTLDDGSIDEPLAGGATVTVDVDISEDAPFHCEIHSSMTGTLTVT